MLEELGERLWPAGLRPRCVGKDCNRLVMASEEPSLRTPALDQFEHAIVNFAVAANIREAGANAAAATLVFLVCSYLS